ncbi:hypothetical protein [Streptomyces sp. GS7]|uniref:hypothetical protein n=1 Tax=Streptomyces sp. GS7 TaxID=2692234 RepID=UPI0013172178|nr:hypothetical protein [Streptomyces sp. GS7]QHC22043.1 hypothetical protein GR130_11975 [Streptomyces sp. GS7]
MKPARLSAAVLISAVALGAAAPGAAARVAPNPVTAGERVTISDGRRCGTDHDVRAVSPLFGTVPLRPGAHGMAADVRVPGRAAPGRYRITVECAPGGPRHTETVMVSGGWAEGVDATQAAGGLALLALAGGAAYLLRRSR